MVSGLLLAMHAIAFNYGTANGNLVDSLELLGSYEGTGGGGRCDHIEQGASSCRRDFWVGEASWGLLRRVGHLTIPNHFPTGSRVCRSLLRGF